MLQGERREAGAGAWAAAFRQAESIPAATRNARDGKKAAATLLPEPYVD